MGAFPFPVSISCLRDNSFVAAFFHDGNNGQCILIINIDVFLHFFVGHDGLIGKIPEIF